MHALGLSVAQVLCASEHRVDPPSSDAELDRRFEMFEERLAELQGGAVGAAQTEFSMLETGTCSL